MTVSVNFTRTGLPDTTLVDNAVRELAGSGVPDDTASATKALVFGGANNDLTFTAVVAGPDGNNLRVAVVQQTGASKAAAVSVDTSAGWLGSVLLPTADPVAATLTVASAGANNDLTFTAKTAGAAGNALQVAVVQATAPSTVLAVAYAAPLATITLPTTAPVAATLTAASAGANNDLTFTAVTAGTAGNSLQVEIVQSSTPNTALAVSYAGSTGTITLPADGGGAPVAATAAAVKTAWDASAAHTHMTVVYEGTGAGTVAAAVAASLTGGDDGGTAVAATAAQVKTKWDLSAAFTVMTVAVEGTGAGNVAAAVAASLTGGDDGGEAVALTAADAKTLWDASAAVGTATVAFEGDGSGNIAAAAAANFTGGLGTGTGFAGTGSRYTRLSNGKEYLNGGTKAAPVWKLVTSA